MPVADFNPVYPNPDCMAIGLSNLSTNAIKYVWYFGDGSQDDTTVNPIHKYTAEGNYIITLKAYNTCGFATKSLPILKRSYVCAGVGIQVSSLDKAEVQLFPNPTKSYTQLLGSGMPNGTYNIEIRNITGQTVYQNTKKVVDNAMDMNLDVSMYASGEYLVTLSSDKETITRKLQILK
jgi:PKD repeat protein